MSNLWKEYKLGDVAEFINGRSFKPEEWESKGRPIIRIQNLTGSIDDPHFTTKSYEDKYLVKKGDLLVSWSATLDAYIWRGNDGWLNQHIFKVKEKPELVTKKFLYLLIKKEIGAMMRQTHGSTMKHITKPRFTSTKILVPSLPLQEKIVNTIEKAEQLREWRKQSDKLTEEYLTNIFLKMFGDPKTNPKNWQIVSIEDIVEYSQYGTSVKSNTKKEGYPLIGMANITEAGKLDLSSYNYVDLSKDEFNKLKLNERDIIFNRTNSTELVGKTTYWSSEIDAVLASYLVKIKLKEIVDPTFFVHLMNTRYFKRLFATRCKKAVNQSNISPTLLKKFEMYLPPIKLQKEFSAVVCKIDKLQSCQEKSSEEMNALFSKLINNMFGGKDVC